MRRAEVLIGLAGLLISSMILAPRLCVASGPDREICDVAADGALGLEDYPRAIALHRAVLQRRPNDALAHYHLGFAYGMAGRLTEELNEYRAAARLGARQWDLFLNLGLAYREQRDLADETAAFEIAVMLGCAHAEAHLNLALAYERENRLNDALHQIALARRLAPHDQDAANANAILCSETGNQACARRIWTDLVNSSPGFAPARANLAILEHAGK